MLKKLTPSAVQMQLVQGLGKALSPIRTRLPPIIHPPCPCPFSFQALKSKLGMELQGTLGFKKFEGRSNADRCISLKASVWSHNVLAKVVFRISAN